jgi:hypothetical protein
VSGRRGMDSLILWRPAVRWIVLAAIAILWMSPLCVAGQENLASWHAMGSIPCSWSVPIQAPDHTLDVPATVRLLKANHFNCYVQPIEERSPVSYADFQRLLPAAQSAGISIWAVHIPHHEGASLPYRYDFVRWVQVLAHEKLWPVRVRPHTWTPICKPRKTTPLDSRPNHNGLMARACPFCQQ